MRQQTEHRESEPWRRPPKPVRYAGRRRGFADASLRELEVATGVNKSGLYSEFKDKGNLFMQSLRYYLESLEKKGLLTAEQLGPVLFRG